MNLKRILLAGVFLDCAVAVVTATAALLVTPQECPVPAAAEAYVPPMEISAYQPEPRLQVQKSVVVLKDVSLSREEGLFGRFAFNPETGLPLGWGHGEAQDCAPETTEQTARVLPPLRP